jgi:hypothetical protein
MKRVKTNGSILGGGGQAKERICPFGGITIGIAAVRGRANRLDKLCERKTAAANSQRQDKEISPPTAAEAMVARSGCINLLRLMFHRS